MLQNRKNRKNRKYLRYVGALFILLGAALTLYTAFILVNTYILKKPVLSPLPKNFKSQNHDLRSILEKEKVKFFGISIATDSSYMVSLDGGGQAIISPRKNIEEQVRSLQIVLSRLTIEGKRFRSLDFRFDKPVVSF